MPGLSGGVFQVIRAIARELFEEPDPALAPTLLTYSGSELAEVGLPTVLVPQPSSTSSETSLRALARRVPGAQRAHHVLRTAWPQLDQSPIQVDGFDVVHLAIQHGFNSSRPTVFSPYDLQHEHLPAMFKAADRRDRRFRYREFAQRAQAVVVMNGWTARDVLERLDVRRERIFVVPLGISKPMSLGSEIHAVITTPATRLSLGPAFALYPAQTWSHKNHLGLGRALQDLRASGLDVPVVCPGHRTAEHRHIEARLAKMGVDDLIVFPGYVSDIQMEVLYRRARMLVFPSLFEGGGMPIFEAMARGLPVACSDVCGLQVATDGAAVLFDPRQPAAIAAAIESVWTDESVRARLGASGLQVANRYTWAEACARLRAIYKLVGGAELSELDGDALVRSRSWQSERST